MKIICLTPIVAFLLVANPAHALTESEKSQATAEVQKAVASSQVRPEPINSAEKTNITGLDWLKLSEKDQLDYIITSMLVLTKHGIVFGKMPVEYCQVVRERLRFNPDFYAVNITNILASIVYEREPDNRQALDLIRKPTKIQKIEMH